jgi:hypothetical protein
VIPDSSGEDEIDCRNVRYSRSRSRLAAALGAEDDIRVEVVVVDESCRAVQVWRCREQSSINGICL